VGQGSLNTFSTQLRAISWATQELMGYEHKNALTNLVRTNTFPMSFLKYCRNTRNPF